MNDQTHDDPRDECSQLEILLHRKTLGDESGTQVGPLPIAGFFCNGEIGPVSDRAFVHGYTSVVGLFGPAREMPQEK